MNKYLLSYVKLLKKYEFIEKGSNLVYATRLVSLRPF
jgi:hypothetical protein